MSAQPSRASQLYSALKILFESSDSCIYAEHIDGWDRYDGLPPFDDVKGDLESLAECGEIELDIPGESNLAPYPVDAIIAEAAECQSLEEGKLLTLRSRTKAWQVVSAASDLANAVEYYEKFLQVQTDSNITLKLTRNSLPVALLACRVGAYHKDWYGAMSGHMVVEADFSQFSGPRSEEGDANLIQSFLFELAASHDVVLKPSVLTEVVEDFPREEEEVQFTLRPVEPFNEGMRLFLAAAQVGDTELRLFSFYKVLEHFSPIVLNLEAYELMRKKLDSPAALRSDGNFIRSVFTLTQGVAESRRNERDMLKSVLLTCIDLIELGQFLPPSLARNLTYSSPSKDVENWARDIAECIYATRNQVAHAKATYDLRGTECPTDELPQLTEFVRAAAAATVRWYNHLPDHQKHDTQG